MLEVAVRVDVQVRDLLQLELRRRLPQHRLQRLGLRGRAHRRGPQGGTQPLNFCHGGNGNLQGIKNNAASAKNKHSTYYSVVYFNSGYKGNSDWIAPGTGWSQLSNTYNDNASFAWQSL